MTKKKIVENFIILFLHFNTDYFYLLLSCYTFPFNVPIKNGEVLDAFRIKKTLPTIKFLQKKN